MNVVYIAIEESFERFEKYKGLWEKRGIIGIWVATMTEGIETVISIEKSKTHEIYFVSIVANEMKDFMEKLSILSAETLAPILIATENYIVKEHHKALDNGADFYGPFCETTEENIDAVMKVIKSIERRNNKKTMQNVISHGRILMSLSQRRVFYNGAHIDLTHQEFDILHCFMSNIGSALSYERIYRCVWDDQYTDTFIEGIKSAVKRLRKKITSNGNNDKIIETVRGFGYRMPL